MEQTIKLRRGLNLHLEGEAQKVVRQLPQPAEVAVRPTDFTGLTPKLLVREGDEVVAGQALLTDKQSGRIHIPSPIGGRVKSVVRGDRRKLLAVVVESVEKADAPLSEGQGAVQEGSLVERLCQAGLFCFFRQRPYDVVASPDDTPKGIFISTFSKMPLAADFSFVLKGEEEAFKEGLKALATIAPVHLGICTCQEKLLGGLDALENVTVRMFDGPNPSGNVGVQINHVSPVNKGEIVWTLRPQAVIFIGRWMQTGRVDLREKVAVAGSEVAEPQYVGTILGAPLRDLVGTVGAHQRVINGNPLVGEKAGADDFLAAFVSEVCVLPEGDDVHEAFGWILPRLKQHSTSRSYLSWLMPGKKYAPDCRIKGGKRHMIMSGEYDRVFPMDIFAGYLIKAIITGDIDRQEALGIYEVAPEDFAVAEYVDSSKLELQRIVREGLDILRKENV